MLEKIQDSQTSKEDLRLEISPELRRFISSLPLKPDQTVPHSIFCELNLTLEKMLSFKELEYLKPAVKQILITDQQASTLRESLGVAYLYALAMGEQSERSMYLGLEAIYDSIDTVGLALHLSSFIRIGSPEQVRLAEKIYYNLYEIAPQKCEFIIGELTKDALYANHLNNINKEKVWEIIYNCPTKSSSAKIFKFIHSEEGSLISRVEAMTCLCNQKFSEEIELTLFATAIGININLEERITAAYLLGKHGLSESSYTVFQELLERSETLPEFLQNFIYAVSDIVKDGCSLNRFTALAEYKSKRYKSEELQNEHVVIAFIALTAWSSDINLKQSDLLNSTISEEIIKKSSDILDHVKLLIFNREEAYKDFKNTYRNEVKTKRTIDSDLSLSSMPVIDYAKTQEDVF